MVAWSHISAVHLTADSRSFESYIHPQKENKTLLCWQVFLSWQMRLGFNSRKGSQQLCVCVWSERTGDWDQGQRRGRLAPGWRDANTRGLCHRSLHADTRIHTSVGDTDAHTRIPGGINHTHLSEIWHQWARWSREVHTVQSEEVSTSHVFPLFSSSNAISFIHQVMFLQHEQIGGSLSSRRTHFYQHHPSTITYFIHGKIFLHCVCILLQMVWSNVCIPTPNILKLTMQSCVKFNKAD